MSNSIGNEMYTLHINGQDRPVKMPGLVRVCSTYFVNDLSCQAQKAPANKVNVEVALFLWTATQCVRVS